MASSVQNQLYPYRDLCALYPDIEIPLFSLENQQERIKEIFRRFVRIEKADLFDRLNRCYNLIYKEGATALYYAADQILSRMEQMQKENPDRPVHVIFSGRDATGLWLMTRAVLGLQQRASLTTDQLHLVYLSRPIVKDSLPNNLRQYIEQTTGTTATDNTYFLVDVGWVGTRFAKLQQILQGNIRCNLLLFSRVPGKEETHVGLIDDLKDPLPEFSLFPEEESKGNPFLALQISYEVNFIEDIFAGPFKEMQVLVERGEKLIPYALLEDLRHESFFTSAPRFFALLALIDRVEEIRQKGLFFSPTRQQARQSMSFVLQNCKGIL